MAMTPNRGNSDGSYDDDEHDYDEDVYDLKRKRRPNPGHSTREPKRTVTGGTVPTVTDDEVPYDEDIDWLRKMLYGPNHISDADIAVLGHKDFGWKKGMPVGEILDGLIWNDNRTVAGALFDTIDALKDGSYLSKVPKPFNPETDIDPTRIPPGGSMKTIDGTIVPNMKGLEELLDLNGNYVGEGTKEDQENLTSQLKAGEASFDGGDYDPNGLDSDSFDDEELIGMGFDLLKDLFEGYGQNVPKDLHERWAKLNGKYQDLNKTKAGKKAVDPTTRKKTEHKPEFIKKQEEKRIDENDKAFKRQDKEMQQGAEDESNITGEAEFIGKDGEKKGGRTFVGKEAK